MSPKFLEGGSYVGARVQTCTYWSTTQTTDKDTDFAVLRGQNNSGNCIANAFVPRANITCFNEGACNGEGKCLPCFQYRYDGLRLGITHSPPLEILRQFDGGLTEDQVKSPNLAAFPPDIVNLTLRDQTPLHILIRNVQAKIAKCCRWNQGDGAPSEFFLTTIIDGPDSIPQLDSEGNEVGTLKGIKVLHEEFPDDVGVFFPVGSVVVAGFRGAPSFYLEPRTGLVKPGEGVIFNSEGDNPVVVNIKRTAVSATRIIIDTANALAQVCNEVNNELLKTQQLLQNAQATENLLQVASLEEQVEAIGQRQEAACTNAQDAQDDANTANNLIGQIVSETDVDVLEGLASDLADAIDALATKGDAVVVAGSGGSATILAGNLLGILRRIGRDIDQSAARSFSKCQFFFEGETNVARVWNNPDDGTPPCNGVRTDCDYYTGQDWEHATEENLEVGKRIS